MNAYRYGFLDIVIYELSDLCYNGVSNTYWWRYWGCVGHKL